MAVPNAFCKIDGIDGDSQISGFEKQIEVIAWNHKVEQPVSVSASGRGSLTVSDTKHSAFLITKELDIASPKLLLHASNGKTIPKIEITLCRQAGDNRIKYMKYELQNCVISTYEPHIDETEAGLPKEKIGITYGKITATYTASDTTGKETGSTACEVDLSQGKVS